MLLMLGALAGVGRADVIFDGDFLAETTLPGLSGDWDSDDHVLGQWYSHADRHGRPAYEITPVGGAVRATPFGRAGHKLLQVVRAPAPGRYALGFEYLLPSGDDSVGRLSVWGLDLRNPTGKGSAGIRIKMDGPGEARDVSGAIITPLYDSDLAGGLSRTGAWQAVGQGLALDVQHDYVAVVAVFAQGGLDSAEDWAAVRSIAITPDPGMAGLLVLSGLALLRRRGQKLQ